MPDPPTWRNEGGSGGTRFASGILFITTTQPNARRNTAREPPPSLVRAWGAVVDKRVGLHPPAVIAWQSAMRRLCRFGAALSPR